ncbi:hypothetical protein ACFWB2_43530 [Streptomyces virginiae]
MTASVEVVLPVNQQRARILELTNPGLGAGFTVSEEAAYPA